MQIHQPDDYLSIEEAASVLGVRPAHVRRLLRSFGLTEVMRASMTKQVKIRRSDLEKLLGAISREAPSVGRGVA